MTHKHTHTHTHSAMIAHNKCFLSGGAVGPSQKHFFESGLHNLTTILKALLPMKNKGPKKINMLQPMLSLCCGVFISSGHLALMNTSVLRSCRDRVVYVGTFMTFFQVYFASLGPGPPGLKIIMDVDADTGQ